jgi:hypothetical protein
LIKFILKLAIFVVLANAGWRVGSAYLNHYRFEDKILEAVQYRGTKTDDQIRQRILELATEFDVPVTEDALTVRRETTHTIVEGSYSEDVDLFPGYAHTFPFTVHLDVPTATIP